MLLSCTPLHLKSNPVLFTAKLNPLTLSKLLNELFAKFKLTVITANDKEDMDKNRRW